MGRKPKAQCLYGTDGQTAIERFNRTSKKKGIRYADLELLQICEDKEGDHSPAEEYRRKRGPQGDPYIFWIIQRYSGWPANKIRSKLRDLLTARNAACLQGNMQQRYPAAPAVQPLLPSPPRTSWGSPPYTQPFSFGAAPAQVTGLGQQPFPQAPVYQAGLKYNPFPGVQQQPLSQATRPQLGLDLEPFEARQFGLPQAAAPAPLPAAAALDAAGNLGLLSPDYPGPELGNEAPGAQPAAGSFDLPAGAGFGPGIDGGVADVMEMTAEEFFGRAGSSFEEKMMFFGGNLAREAMENGNDSANPSGGNGEGAPVVEQALDFDLEFNDWALWDI